MFVIVLGVFLPLDHEACFDGIGELGDASAVHSSLRRFDGLTPFVDDVLLQGGGMVAGGVSWEIIMLRIIQHCLFWCCGVFLASTLLQGGGAVSGGVSWETILLCIFWHRMKG